MTRQQHNKNCSAYYHRNKHKKAFKLRYKKKNLNYNYGKGTADYYLAQNKKQKSKCNICKKKRKLVLDHCHKTKRRRPLVCRQCNIGIGMLGDSIKLLRRAIKHLQQ